jgi:hypothetical protein
MSPFQIHILLHYYACVDDYPHPQRIVEEAAEPLLLEGLLVRRIPAQEGPNNLYRCTEKGEFYVDALCNLPMPKAVWVIPVRAALMAGRDQ